MAVAPIRATEPMAQNLARGGSIFMASIKGDV